MTHVEVERQRPLGFDRDAPVTPDGPSAVTSSAHVPDGLNWQRFSAAYFPGRRRHDLEALTAYSAYKRTREADAGSPEEPVPIEPARGLTGATDAVRGDDDGGTTPGHRGGHRR